jgi:hypothetical protein
MLPTEMLFVKQTCVALNVTTPIAKSHPKLKKLELEQFKLLMSDGDGVGDFDYDIPSLLPQDCLIEKIVIWSCFLSRLPNRFVVYDLKARRYEFVHCKNV